MGSVGYKLSASPMILMQRTRFRVLVSGPAFPKRVEGRV